MLKLLGVPGRGVGVQVGRKAAGRPPLRDFSGLSSTRSCGAAMPRTAVVLPQQFRCALSTSELRLLSSNDLRPPLANIAVVCYIGNGRSMLGDGRFLDGRRPCKGWT